jgi:hypothetical protein
MQKTQNIYRDVQKNIQKMNKGWKKHGQKMTKDRQNIDKRYTKKDKRLRKDRKI